jgi:addiction module HigA family antidote
MSVRRSAKKNRKKIKPLHPGTILSEEYLEPMEISQYRLAKEIHVPARRINEIVQGKRSITAYSAIRLARFFSTTEQFWMNLQSHFDLEKQRDRIGNALSKSIQPHRSAAA